MWLNIEEYSNPFSTFWNLAQENKFAKDSPTKSHGKKLVKILKKKLIQMMICLQYWVNIGLSDQKKKILKNMKNSYS